MGEFDGNGKTISNLRYDISGSSASSEADTGLFAFTKGANIHDFIIKDSVIDADYRGDIGVILINLSNEPPTIEPGERICQMVIAQHEQPELEQVQVLSETQRGAGGFGHSGVK